MIHLDCLGQFPFNIYIVCKLGLVFWTKKEEEEEREELSFLFN